MSHVVDANLSVALVLSTPYSTRAQALWQRWSDEGVDLYAPDLWAYEVTTALRKAMSLTGMSLPEAEARLEVLSQLGLNLVPPALELERSALRWAERLAHTAAYDGQYLALAEALGCDFWTADRRLAHAARAVAAWVRWIGET